MDDNSSEQELEPGTIIDSYEIISKLGSGAMAIVYLAEQTDLGRYVALKVLKSSLAENEEYVSRFFNEARAAASLSHPNIIQAYKAGETEDGIYFFCMEYIEGESLLSMIKSKGRIPLDEALPLFIEVADALDYGWQTHKFTHGDIKPENIMVTTRGQAKLADFGLAKVEGSSFEGSEVMLTPLYAAPELIKSDHSPDNCRADIYAFGATLYHALAGTPPLPGTDAQEVMDKQLHENPEPLRLKCPEVPRALSDMVAKTLIKDPEKRLQSWQEILNTLREVSQNAASRTSSKLTLPPKASRPNAFMRREEPKKSKVWIVVFSIIGAAMLGLLGMCIYFAVSNSGNSTQLPEVEAGQP